MAKPNYQFEKRQRELAKKKKKEEKLQQRRSGGADAGAPDADADQEGTEGVAPDGEPGNDDAGEAPQAEASA